MHDRCRRRRRKRRITNDQRHDHGIENCDSTKKASTGWRAVTSPIILAIVKKLGATMAAVSWGCRVIRAAGVDDIVAIGLPTEKRSAVL